VTIPTATPARRKPSSRSGCRPRARGSGPARAPPSVPWTWWLPPPASRRIHTRLAWRPSAAQTQRPRHGGTLPARRPSGELLRSLEEVLPLSDTTPVSRFRSSHHCAARSFANFGIEGHWQLIDPVWLWFRSPHFGFAAEMMRTSEPPHWCVHSTSGPPNVLSGRSRCTARSRPLLCNRISDAQP